MKLLWPRGIVVIFLIGVISTGAWADQIIFSNGDVLSGTVLSIQQGKVAFDSEQLGQLSLELSKIKSIQTDQSNPIILRQDGEKIEGRLKTLPDGVVLETESQSRAIELGDIVALGAGVSDKAEGEDEGKFKWSGEIDMGAYGRQGNTERTGAQANLSIQAKNPDWTFSGYVKGRYAQEEVDNKKILSDNEIKGGGQVKRNIGNRLNLFFALDLEKDKLEELRLRSVYNGGLGIRWVDNDRWYFENAMGIGGQRETFENAPSRSTCIGNMTGELRYKVNSRIDIRQKTSWFPDIKDRDSYRINAQSFVTIYLDNSHKLFLKSGLEHEYDSRPSPGVEQLDTHYFTNLGYNF